MHQVPLMESMNVRDVAPGSSDIDMEQASSGVLSLQGAIFNFVTGAVGAGLLALPSVMGRNGEPRAGISGGIILFMIAGLFQNVANRCICEAIEMTGCKRCASLEKLARCSLGKHGQAISSSLANVMQLGFLVAYIILLGSMLARLCNVSLHIGVMIVGCALTPLAFCPLSNLAGCVGVCATALLIPIIATGAISHGSSKQVSFYGTYDQFGPSFCTILFANGFGFLVPSVRADMTDPTMCAKASDLALIICICLYGSVMGLGYYAWGNNLPGNVLDVLDDPALRNAAQVFLCIKLLISYIVMMDATVKALGDSLQLKTFSFLLFLRISLAALVTATAYCVPYFSEFMDLVAAFTMVACNFLLPPACYWTLRSQMKGCFRAAAQENPTRLIMHSAMALGGLLAMVFGIVGGFENLAAALSRS